MRRLIILVVSVISLVHVSFAQKKFDFATLDAKMTMYYMAGNWDSVIYYGKAGLADSVDYYYLRKRMGEAYYYKHNYSKAIVHFEKALDNNSTDASLQEFLYYSYLFSGSEAEARMFQKQMTTAALKNVNAKKDFCFDDFYFETGASLNNNFSKNQGNDFNGSPDIFGAAEMSGRLAYGHLGAKILAGHRVSFYIGGGVMNEQKKSVFNATNVKPAGRTTRQWDTIVWKPDPPPMYQTHDTIIEKRQAFSNEPLVFNNDNALHQNEFYLNCNLHAAKGFDIQPFFHLINTRMTLAIPKSNEHDFIVHDTVETHTQYHYPSPPGGIKDTVFYNYISETVKVSDYKFMQKDTMFVNYSLGLALIKSFGNASASLFGNISNLNGGRQRELGVSVTWFPKGNLDLYVNASLVNYREGSSRQLVTNLLAGKKITDKIWLEGNLTAGDMHNYTEKNGFVVYNNPDPIKFRAGLKPIILFRKFDIIILYQFQAKQGLYSFRTKTGNMRDGTFNYTNQLITGGIKWKL